MRNRLIGLFIVGLLFAAAGQLLAGDQPAPTPAAPSADTVASPPDSVTGDRIVATYFHGNRRCATCQKLEAYSTEAITAGFAKEIEAGLIEWRVVNYDEEANAHFAEDYQLFSQSVILSRQHAGKETEWKNLDQIWQLVGDKDKFIAYVQGETKAFLTGEPQK